MKGRWKRRSGLLASWPLALCAACADIESEAVQTPERRVLVIGWDGASWKHIDALLADGQLPVLRSVIERGNSAACESTVIPISSAAWTGAVTGVGPGQNGVYSFFEPEENSYDIGVISSLSNKATPLWRILTQRGIGCHLFGIPITYPPEPVFGTMVAGMLSPPDSVYAHPPEMVASLRQLGFMPALGEWREENEVTWSNFIDQVLIKEAVLDDLLSGPNWRFAMVVFKSLDNLSHRAYGPDFLRMVGPLYVELDQVLGNILKSAGPDTDVILISDHGFDSYFRGFNVYRYLIEGGFAVLRETAPEFATEAGPLAIKGSREHQNRLNALQLGRTRAFPTHGRGNFGALRLNVKGREPEGCVDPADTEAVLEELEAWLRAAKTPAGTPIVVNTWRGQELYPGPHAGIIPELLFEVQPATQVILNREGLVYGDHSYAIPDHARDGIFIAAGPNARAIAERGRVSIFDLAPTVLHLLDLPVYEEMTGQALEDRFELPAPHRIAESDDPFHVDAPAQGRRPFTPEELKELEERLRGLGYTE